VFQRALRDEGLRNGLVLQLARGIQGSSWYGIVTGMVTMRGNGRENNQVRSEVLGTSRADLYTGGSMSKYSTSL
jgi:hypothetical protein